MQSTASEHRKVDISTAESAVSLPVSASYVTEKFGNKPKLNKLIEMLS